MNVSDCQTLQAIKDIHKEIEDWCKYYLLTYFLGKHHKYTKIFKTISQSTDYFFSTEKYINLLRPISIL